MLPDCSSVLLNKDALLRLKIFTAAFILLAVLSLFYLFVTKSKINTEVPSNGETMFSKFETHSGDVQSVSPAVVELFTSEGCSSCPPADELLINTQNEFGKNMIALSYHVDYWDRLGWRDPFSKSMFTERQRKYATHFNLESIYTPQAVVNGKKEIVGSDKKSLWGIINNLKPGAASSIILDTQFSNGNCSVNYEYYQLKTDEVLVLELVLKSASIKVKRGENGGATLNHVNIVREMIQTSEPKGVVSFYLSPDYQTEDFTLVAFIQNKETLAISGAVMKSLKSN